MKRDEGLFSFSLSLPGTHLRTGAFIFFSRSRGETLFPRPRVGFDFETASDQIDSSPLGRISMASPFPPSGGEGCCRNSPDRLPLLQGRSCCLGVYLDRANLPFSRHFPFFFSPLRGKEICRSSPPFSPVSAFFQIESPSPPPPFPPDEELSSFFCLSAGGTLGTVFCPSVPPVPPPPFFSQQIGALPPLSLDLI